MQLWEAVTGSVTAGALDSGILDMGIAVEVSNAGFLLDELSEGVGTSSRYGGPFPWAPTAQDHQEVLHRLECFRRCGHCQVSRALATSWSQRRVQDGA